MLPAVSDMLEKKGFFLAEIEVKLLIEEELTRLKTPAKKKEPPKAVRSAQAEPIG